jgi:hypothetical protein
LFQTFDKLVGFIEQKYFLGWFGLDGVGVGAVNRLAGDSGGLETEGLVALEALIYLITYPQTIWFGSEGVTSVMVR